MRKLALALVLAFGVSGCATSDIKDFFGAVGVASTSISNPVTLGDLDAFENGAIVVFVGLKTYKQACVDLLLPQSCKDTIASIQVYTRQVPPLLQTVRAYVKNNDQVNAVVAYNTLKQLLANAKAIATANNVKVN